jgi:Putative MetA-pathway of phenol degradation
MEVLPFAEQLGSPVARISKERTMARKAEGTSACGVAIIFRLVATTAIALATTSMIKAEESSDCPILSCLTGTAFDCNNCEEKKDEDEEKCSYGPCPCCHPRKTLMQWSYGTTFSGGPPSMDEPLEADRPDFTESPLTVGKGVVQVEMGYTFTSDGNLGVRTTDHNFPQMLWRIGMLAEWFEFRVLYNYDINEQTFPSGNHLRMQGSEDLELGAKICLTPQEGILPAMGLIPAMTAPTGAPGITEGEVMPSLMWAYQWEFTKKVSLGMTTTVARQRDDLGNIFVEFSQSGSLDVELTKKLAMYNELYLLSPTGRTDEQVQYYYDGGFTYHVTNNLQLDIEAGVGLNRAANDYFAGSGLVVRY